MSLEESSQEGRNRTTDGPNGDRDGGGSITQHNVDDNDVDDQIVEPVSGLTDCATASTVIDMKNLASAASAFPRPPLPPENGRSSTQYRLT